jgi:hypothetical protein
VINHRIINTTGVTIGAGTAFPLRSNHIHPHFLLVFFSWGGGRGVRVAQYLVFWVAFWRPLSVLFVILMLAFVLPALLSFKASEPFSIFIPF